MPRVARSRALAIDPARVWDLIADPHNLPRWWSGTARVESVNGDAGSRRSSFTQVLQTRDGTPVRADYRVSESTRRERLVWEQRIAGTPFEKFLRASELEFRIDPDQDGARVTVEGRRLLRGLSRLGGPMMSRATRRSLDELLDGIEEALLGPAGGSEAGSAGREIEPPA